MEKIKLTAGVYWIGIPEIDLFVLCGCPADIVKHMMKRGLITGKEKDGTSFETGPNAILLSDVSVQKGDFSNLAEFPVLQMFYRQGLIIPDHPNNTGRKPMLIGIKNQVEAQSTYIFRGNYGLTSKDEIMKTGIHEPAARDMMRIKIKFAFDRISRTEDLLDVRIVDKEKVELRDGAFIRRRRFNVYEIYYGNRSMTVDLNLARGERYESAYILGFHKIRKEYFSVIHIGEGNGWDFTRPCMGSIISFQGKLYLIDAGPNIMHSLTALGISVSEIDGIFHTHCHDDHFASLTSIVRSDHMIKYFATPLVRESVAKKLSALMSMSEERFSRYFEIHDLEFDVWNNIDGLEVKPVLSPHPVETNIFFFRSFWENGYKTYAHMADIASFKVLGDMITGDDSESGITQEYFDSVKEQYLVPVDLKKIDIGGGLVHGAAEDFIDDTSGKILLSHTARELTDREKEIGSSTSFGTQDVLIAARQDYKMQAAFRFLRSYFPTAPDHELRTILNFPIINLNPGTILLKRGAVNKRIYLILTGVVEYIESETTIKNMLSAGTLAGEISGMRGDKSGGTFRADSYVQAIEIPRDIYLEFVKRNNMYYDIMRAHENRRFLLGTWLFGEMVSYPMQNRIARLMEKTVFREGELLPDGNGAELILIAEGEIQVYSENKIIETLGRGGFVGEESVLFDTASFFKARATQDSACFRIPGEALAEIPNIQWKLFETFEKRMRAFGAHFAFAWKKDYSVNVRELDEQHKVLFEMVNNLCEAFTHLSDKSFFIGKLGELTEYAGFLFSREETLMKKCGYHDLDYHAKEHKRLMQDIDSFGKRFSSGTAVTGMEFLDFLKDWLVNHTLVVDKKYTAVMNGHGIF